MKCPHICNLCPMQLLVYLQTDNEQLPKKILPEEINRNCCKFVPADASLLAQGSHRVYERLMLVAMCGQCVGLLVYSMMFTYFDFKCVAHCFHDSLMAYFYIMARSYLQLDAFCFSIVERIKDAFGWAGDIMTEKSVGAWIGELPVFLRSDADSNSEETPSCSIPIKENDEELKSSAQDIASYQVC